MCATIYWEFKVRGPLDLVAVRRHVTICVEEWVNNSQNNIVEVTWAADGGVDYTGKQWVRQPMHTLVQLDFPESQMAVMFKLGFMDDYYVCL